MKYITRVTYKGPNLIGQPIEILEGTFVSTQDNIICYNRLPVCYINSQTGHDYFVWADDGNQLDRVMLENKIWFSKTPQIYPFEYKIIKEDGSEEIEIRYRMSKYSQKEIKYLQQTFSKYLNDTDAILFNNAWYQAPIIDLQRMLQGLSS